MDLFQSIQALAETAGLSYDAALLLFGKAVFIYEVCKAAVFVFTSYAVYRLFDFLFRKCRKRSK